MDTVKKTVCIISETYYKIEKLFIVAATLLIGALIVVEIILRAVGVQGFRWIEEAGRYMLITTSIVGSSMAVRENGHMVMDVLYTKLSPRIAYIVKAITYLFCGIFYCFLSYHAYDWLVMLKKMQKTWESVDLPFWPLWIFVVISLATMGLRYFVQTGKCIASFRAKKEEFSEMNTQEM